MSLFLEKTVILCALTAVIAVIALGPLVTSAAQHLLKSFGYPGCMFRAVFGRPCPLCGGTASFAATIRGDLAGAWRENPFVLLLLATMLAAIPALAVALVWPASVLPMLRLRAFRIIAVVWAIVLALALVLFWIARLL